MNPTPPYGGQDSRPAYQLRYVWSAWPAGPPIPRMPSDDWLRELSAAWETDGIRPLEFRWTDEQLQITFSTQPHVAPVVLAGRAKGRIEHALRTAGRQCRFSRKLAVRSIGESTSETVVHYVAQQVHREPFADERFRARLQRLVYVNDDAAIVVPIATGSGRYWYALHVVLTTPERASLRPEELQIIHDRSFDIAAKLGCAIGALAVMPDHLHLAIRGSVQRSPREMAISFQNNLAYALGQRRVWSDGFYVGTFGAYDMHAIRTAVAVGRKLGDEG